MYLHVSGKIQGAHLGSSEGLWKFYVLREMLDFIWSWHSFSLKENVVLKAEIPSSKMKTNNIFFRKEGNTNYASLSSEPIQSRCAVLRYTKLTDSQILARLLKIVEKEDVPYTDDGLEAIIFTAQGDMRQVKEAKNFKAKKPLNCGSQGFIFG